MTPPSTQYLTEAQIAEGLGVSARNIGYWLTAYQHTTGPFPAPDVASPSLGWDKSRWPQIRDWHEHTILKPGWAKKLDEADWRETHYTSSEVAKLFGKQKQWLGLVRKGSISSSTPFPAPDDSTSYTGHEIPLWSRTRKQELLGWYEQHKSQQRDPDLLTFEGVAAALDTTASILRNLRKRNSDGRTPMPEPVSHYIHSGKQCGQWNPDQIPEIKAWRDSVAEPVATDRPLSTSHFLKVPRRRRR